MARPFSYPEVAALEEGGVCLVPPPYEWASRRIREFAKRCKPPREFVVTRCTDEHGRQRVAVCRVRLPVTDAELPGA